ncbi:patatin-like phospholipase family protein [Thalassoroseus pseudoceratinae]|uniref:patatin-like phospholipase family protein n=1 Tax=Thalassoroseus pseudoceratinae TaxID=2713176 RepID=UPI00141FF6D3|nr:patatin-like phospholipase family protein [Thalassoroseus pseudoceratinae]
MSKPSSDNIPRYLEERVLANERRKITVRRQRAGFSSPNPSSSDTDTDSHDISVDDECVGLALSGGGVRSAAFSLGLLQAFHRFGVLRFVDFISAVSGGTYAAAMLTNAVDGGEKYRKDNFCLSQEETGKQHQRVREVSKRTNYLYRVDIFLGRYLPNLLLNLAPRAATIIAVGAGVAFLWRCLDYHGVRDHLAVMGLGGDLLPAFIPAVTVGILWILSYLVGILVESPVLKRLATKLMWTTLVCIAIGFAVIIGNGDVSIGTKALSDNDGEEISWLSNVSFLFATLVALGCLPFLAPRRLLKSGVAPEKLSDSWIFYYASLALFLGVPLVAIGWFSQENISSFNDARGPDVLAGDIRDQRGFAQLASGEFDGYIVDFEDLGFRAEVQINGAFGLFHSGDDLRSFLSEGQHTKIDELFDGRKAQDIPDKISDDMLYMALLELNNKKRDELDVGKIFPTDNQRLASEDFNDTAEENNQTVNSWTTWKFGRLFTERIPNFTHYLMTGDMFSDLSQLKDAKEPKSDVGKAIQFTQIQRKVTRDLLRHFNSNLNSQLLFKPQKPNFEATNGGPGTVIELSKADLPHFLVEKLKVIAADLDKWKGKSGQDSELIGAPPHREEFAQINRGLLENVFPNIIRPKSEVRRAILIKYDQRHRLIWFCGSLVVALALAWYVNPNKTGLHGYYRDRLAATYFFDQVEDEQTTYPDEGTPQLFDIATEKQGLPYLLFNAATPTRVGWKIADQLETPFSSFLLSQKYYGNKELGYVETKKLGKRGPSIADTIAISGAALNPAYFVQHIVSLIMNVVNLRTGQVLPNPNTLGQGPIRPSMLRECMQNLFRSPEEMSNILLTDGGYIENLGVEELLKRRCRLVIVCDAGNDPDHHFDDLAKVLRRIQDHHGIRIAELPTSSPESSVEGLPIRMPIALTDPLLTGSENRTKRQEHLAALADERCNNHRSHFFVARILYPESHSDRESDVSERRDREGILIYLKPSLTGDEGIRLFNFARRSDFFPHDPTKDQSFSESQFSAYLQLGFHVGADLGQHMKIPDLQGEDIQLEGRQLKAGANTLLQLLFPQGSPLGNFFDPQNNEQNGVRETKNEIELREPDLEQANDTAKAEEPSARDVKNADANDENKSHEPDQEKPSQPADEYKLSEQAYKTQTCTETISCEPVEEQSSGPAEVKTLIDRIAEDIEEFAAAPLDRRSELRSTIEEHGSHLGLMAHKVAIHQEVFRKSEMDPKKIPIGCGWDGTSLKSIEKIFKRGRVKEVKLAIDWLKTLQKIGISIQDILATLRDFAIYKSSKSNRTGPSIVQLIREECCREPKTTRACRQALNEIVKDADDDTQGSAREALTQLKQ